MLGFGGLLVIHRSEVWGATTLKSKVTIPTVLRIFLYSADNICTFTYLTVVPSLMLFR